MPPCLALSCCSSVPSFCITLNFITESLPTPAILANSLRVSIGFSTFVDIGKPWFLKLSLLLSPPVAKVWFSFALALILDSNFSASSSLWYGVNLYFNQYGSELLTKSTKVQKLINARKELSKVASVNEDSISRTFDSSV